MQSDSTSENNKQGITITGMMPKNFPIIPGTNKSGEKAATVVRTAKTTGLAIFLRTQNGAVNAIVVVFHVAVDVLAHDDGVVHDDAEDEDEGEE